MKPIQLGNSRLIYQAQSVESADILQAQILVDQFLLASRASRLAQERILVYPRGGDEIWVGKEIVGFPGALPEGLRGCDFSSCEAWETLAPAPAKKISELLEPKQLEKLGEGKKLLRLVLELDHFAQPRMQFSRELAKVQPL